MPVWRVMRKGSPMSPSRAAGRNSACPAQTHDKVAAPMLPPPATAKNSALSMKGADFTRLTRRVAKYGVSSPGSRCPMKPKPKSISIIRPPTIPLSSRSFRQAPIPQIQRQKHPGHKLGDEVQERRAVHRIPQRFPVLAGVRVVRHRLVRQVAPQRGHH